jgi:hypothetical protein
MNEDDSRLINSVCRKTLTWQTTSVEKVEYRDRFLFRVRQ